MNSKLLFLLPLILLTALLQTLTAQVLFDNTKAETAGNADWIIDTHQPVPSPSITGIGAGTTENYWTGALSSWGVALAKLGNSGQISLPGNGLETLPSGGQITYGNASNAQDLSHYKVFVVCEPNILFTATEKTAILLFVQNGGGLFMVADHTSSDRNSDGADSLQIWNDLFSNNTVQTTPFGFTFNVDSGTPTATVDSALTNPMTHGLGGTVTTLKYSVGCTMNINDTAVCHAAAWQTNPSQVMALYGTFGAGRFCAIGDSSVVEDVTSSQGTTFAGWTTPLDNGYCVINGMVWLLNTNSSALAPTVTAGNASALTTNSATLNGTVNPNGQSTTAKFFYGLTTNYNLTAAISGTLAGSAAQAVSANLAGLSPGTTYHFNLTATNISGSVTGLDQAFTTASFVLAAPSVITAGASAIGTNFVTLNATVNPNNQTSTAQFLYGLTTNYNFIATVSGTLAGGSAQAVSATINGIAPATTYHFAITATNFSGSVTGLDQSFTTASMNSSGGTNFIGILAAWEVTGLSSYGPSPFAATSNAPNVSVMGLTRGSGVGTVNMAGANAWGGTGFVFANEAAAITGNSYATFSLTNTSAGKISCTNIAAYNVRHTSAGSTTGIWQYQVGNGAFTDIGSAITWGAVTSSTGNPETAIDLSGISALQNIPTGTNVTFRIVLWGGTGGGSWYINNLTTGYDLIVSGTIIYPTQSGVLPPILAWRQQWFGLTNNSGSAADTNIASADGMPNLLKYALGLNPLLTATNPIIGDITTGFLRLIVPRNTNATDITYLIESTGAVATGWNTNATIVDVNLPALLQAHDTNAVPATSQRFIRLHITRP